MTRRLVHKYFLSQESMNGRRKLHPAAMSLILASLIAGSLNRQSTVAAPPRIDEFDRRVESLSVRINELSPSDDVLDNLYFGWFDRPQARATMAVLVKTSAVLRREVRMRRVGNGAIPKAELDDMLRWADDAVARAVASEPDPRFRPHRLRITPDDIRRGDGPPLFALVDRSTSTRQNVDWGDLDLLAALGQRVYVRDTIVPFSAGSRPTPLVQRAAYLGMASVAMESAERSDDISVMNESSESAILRVTPRTLTELLTKTQTQDGSSHIAVMEADVDEAWPARAARRALVRGMTRQRRALVDRWRAPRPIDVHHGYSAIETAVWFDAFDGLALATVDGWRDVRDGSARAAPSLLIRPRELERFASTSLRVLRHSDVLHPLMDLPRVAVAVSLDAVHPDDPNRWAAWMVPVLEAMFESQIPFDINSNSFGPSSGDARYPVVFNLTRESANQVVAAFRERAFGVQVANIAALELSVRDGNGSAPTDLFVRVAYSGDRRLLIAAVNLSNETRFLAVVSEKRLPPFFDVLSDDSPIGAEGRFTLAPGQAVLLTSR